METDPIDQVREFMRSHLKDEFSLDELARFVGYSAYHLAREFKEATGQSVMECARAMRIVASAEELKQGMGVCNTAMEYGFETHSGFTRAFRAVFGCTPEQYVEHTHKPYERTQIMEKSSIIVRPISTEDVQDLWENVYSAMTPRQITDLKILPSIEAEQAGKGLQLVAQVDGKVVMALPMLKPYWIPIGFLFDNNYVLTGGDEDTIMAKLLAEMKRQCAMLNVSTLISPQKEGSENIKAFVHFGFTEAFTSGGWSYLMMAV